MLPDTPTCANPLEMRVRVDELSFGDVKARVCSPELVWDALHVPA